MAQIFEVIRELEKHFPLDLQEDYDNSGLQIGSLSAEITGVYLTLDVTLQTIVEAIEKGCNLIISHHPLFFKPLKQINLNTDSGKIIELAIKNNITIYSSHTNLDNSIEGINSYIAKKLGLKNLRIIQESKNKLYKIVTFVPFDYAEKVRQAIFDAGAGNIGNYDSCSYNIEGKGTFRANELANPFVGEKGQIHYEPEVRIETIVEKWKLSKVIETMLKAHPYEEVAYDIYPLDNKYNKAGSGIYGEFEEAIDEETFLGKCKSVFNIQHFKHSKINKSIKKIAIVSGAGNFLIENAISLGCDAFISGEFKYSDFIAYGNKICLIEAGHFETEIFCIEIFYDIISKNFNSFAITKANTKNNYYYL